MDKKAYNKVLVFIFLIMLLSALLMYKYGTEREESGTGITGNAVLEEQPQTKPIQEVSKDLERMGAERVANEPGLRYAE